MWAVLLQVLAVAAGWQLVRALPMRWHQWEDIAASVAVGFAVAPWLIFVSVGVLGWGVGLPLAVLALAAATVWSQWRLPRRAELIAWPPRPAWQRWAQRAVAAAVVLAVGWMVVISYNFPAADGNWSSNGNVWGDSPLHVGLITQFSHGDRLDMVSPIYLKVPLSYPIMGDFWSGALMRLTSDWHLGLMLPTLAMMLAVLQLIFSFGYRLLRSLRAAWLQWLMLVFSGSLRGAFILGNVLLTKGFNAYNTTVGNSLAFATGDNYLNFIHSHLLPQRAYLFGMPVLIVVMMIVLHIYRETKLHRLSHENTLRLGLIAGLLAGLLPLIHTHSFMIWVGIMLLATAVLLVRNRGHAPSAWWLTIVTALTLALPQLFWQFRTTYYSQFGHWIFGWMMQNFELRPNDNWFLFWFLNIGLMFIAILVGWYFLWRERARVEIWLTYVAGVSIFFICNLYVFQPSTWDNMKFFEYGFWMIMLAMAYVMARWSRRLWGAVAVTIIMISMCTMGFFTLVLTGPQQKFQILSSTDVKVGRYVQESLPNDAYILVGDQHDNPVTMLGDRKVLMTFSGWYNLYDANWPTTLADRDAMLHGDEGALELIRQYGVNYAAFSKWQTSDGEANLNFFSTHFAQVYSQNGWYIFDLQGKATLR